MRVTAPQQIREPEHLSFLSTAQRARKRLDIDLGDVAWISPLGVVAVLATCLRSDDVSLDASVILPNNAEARAYLAQIGFLQELEVHGWMIEDGPSVDASVSIAPHLPVSRVTTEQEVERAANTLAEALQETDFRGTLADDLLVIAAELTANAREHGRDCYVVAQTHTGQRSGTRGVHIAVADFGPGFAATLRQHHGPMSDSEAIALGFDESVSGTGDAYRGHGLQHVAEAIDKHADNVLHIVSRTGHVMRTGSRLQTIDHLSFEGTLASAYLPAPPPSL